MESIVEVQVGGVTTLVDLNQVAAVQGGNTNYVRALIAGTWGDWVELHTRNPDGLIETWKALRSAKR
jgi:hypothetical protein